MDTGWVRHGHMTGQFLKKLDKGVRGHDTEIYREYVNDRESAYIDMSVHPKVLTSNNIITFNDNIYANILTYCTLL